MLIKDVAAVPAMVLAICESESRPAAHANLAVGPLRWSTTVYHAAGDVDLGRKCETFSL